jgi:ParB-like chromosome segregation protein Spo0J
VKYQVMPDLTPIEFEALKADIAEHGVLVPVEVDEDGELLDGHHRVRAWQELRQEGKVLPTYSKLVRLGWSEEQKRNHARRLNLLRRNLNEEQRKQVAEDMARDKATLQEIADALGVSVKTAHRDLAESTLSNDKVATSKGKDGKERPRKYKARKPKEPQQTIFQAGDADDIDPDDAEETVKGIRQERIVAKREQRQEERKVSTVAVNSAVWHGDMRELGKSIESSTVDLILTDPPYPEEFLPLFSELSVLAERILKPGGLCLVYSGQIFLPEVMGRLCVALEYAWTFAIRHSGGNQRIFKVNVNTGWKPVIAFYKPPLSIWWDSFIDVVSGGREKDLHEWQQAESEAAYFIEHLTLPGQVVVDPFCGSGTVLKAAKNLGRQYQGIELNPEHVENANKRLTS